MRAYTGTNEPCTGDCIRIDGLTSAPQAFSDCIIEGIEDNTVYLARPHIHSDGGLIWGTSLKVERFTTTLTTLVRDYRVHTRDNAQQEIDNRNRFPSRIPPRER